MNALVEILGVVFGFLVACVLAAAMVGIGNGILDYCLGAVK